MPAVFQILIAAETEGEQDRILLVDGTLRESPSVQSTPTRYPVGAGRTMSDHIQHQPADLSVDIIVTETPNRELDDPLAFDHSIVTHVNRVGDQDAMTFGSSRALRPFERARTLFESLDQIRLSSRFLTVTTALKYYGRMVMTSLEAPVDGPQQSVIISVGFQEIDVAESRLETAAIVTSPRLRRTDQNGTQNGSEETTGQRRLSTAQALERLIGGFLPQ
jgi:hypothetical protein